MTGRRSRGSRLSLRAPTWTEVDVLAAVALAVAGIIDTIGHRVHGPEPVVLGLAVVAAAPIGFRRRAPLAAAAVFFAATALEGALFFDLTSTAVPLFGVLLLPYATAAYADGARAVAGLLLSLAGFVAVDLATGNLGVADVFFVGGFIVASWACGRAVRVRARLAAELHEAAVRAQEEREAGAAQAIADERRRIAREMHDIVAHSVSVMVIQAGGARRILDRDPGRAVEAAERIERAGREAMVEMRRLLGVLHAGEPEQHAARAPAPTMAGLDDLVRRARDAGLPVTLDVEGERRDLAPGLELAAYRVVQEALTNALKYAGHAPTAVRVRWAPDALELAVEDHGGGDEDDASPVLDGTGHGLIGMRERVRVYGGELETGRRRGGGFAVRARLPLIEEESLV